jgi:hypothetical protein
MKFLCVPCDSPMRLAKTEESEPGSLSVVYSCPQCGYEMAMLTNAQETQMVRSLGVRIGPASEKLAAAGGAAAEGSPAPSKCPFSAMLPQRSATADGPAWTAGALARLEAIPEMVRPMAKAGIEMVAKEQGTQVIDEALLTTARTRFGM